MKIDVIKTLKKRPASKRHRTSVARAKAKSVKKREAVPPVKLDDVEWRVVLTIHRADELTDAQRFAIVNWLRAKTTELGDDTYGRNLASTYRARLVI